MTYFIRQMVVKGVLEEIPASRDDDFVLIAEVIKRIEGEKLDKLSGHDLIDKFLTGKYGAFESLTRSRRKWQENVPRLRGEKYKDRQAFSCKFQMTFWEND